jgi:hypothetical protein
MDQRERDSASQAAKLLAIAFGAPALVYWLIFHHFSCRTGAEQFVAAVLGLAGLGVAVKVF